MTFGIAGDADIGEIVPYIRNLAQKGEGVWKAAGVVGISADYEDVIDVGSLQTPDET